MSEESKAEGTLSAGGKSKLFEMAFELALATGCDADDALGSLLKTKARLDALGSEGSQPWL